MKKFIIGLCKTRVVNIKSGGINATTKAVKEISLHLSTGDPKTSVTAQSISNNHCVLTYETRYEITKEFADYDGAWEYAKKMIKRTEKINQMIKLVFIEEC